MLITVDLDRGGAGDDVVVGDHLAVGGEDHAGAGRLAVLVAERRHDPHQAGGLARGRRGAGVGAVGWVPSPGSDPPPNGSVPAPSCCWRQSLPSTGFCCGDAVVPDGRARPRRTRRRRRARAPSWRPRCRRPSASAAGGGARRLDRLRCRLGRHGCGLCWSSMVPPRREIVGVHSALATCAEPVRRRTARCCFAEKFLRVGSPSMSLRWAEGRIRDHLTRSEGAEHDRNAADRRPRRPGRSRSRRCGSGRRRTPARVTRSPRPAGGCRWSRSTRRRRWSARPARSA